MKISNHLEGCLILSYTPGIGALTFKKIIEYFGSVEHFFAASFETWLESGLSKKICERILKVDYKKITNALEFHQQHSILTLEDSHYPHLLKHIADPPIVLFVKGNKTLLDHPQIAIVGSRKATEIGKQTAFEFANQLSQQGFVITSGLALGIDSAAHKGALEGSGYTIAVFGTGLDTVYPLKNKALAEKILENNGVLVSEFALESPPKAEHFPQRNRIISGLSLGVLVIEAGLQSGSLVTARLANEQGREVFAVPGSIYNPLSQGAHQLIKQGVKLVENIEDVLEEIPIEMEKIYFNTKDAGIKNQKSAIKTLPLEHKNLLQYVGFEPTTIDSIVERSGLSVDVITPILFMLELQGVIIASPDGAYFRLPER